MGGISSLSGAEQAALENKIIRAAISVFILLSNMRFVSAQLLKMASPANGQAARFAEAVGAYADVAELIAALG